MKAICLNSFSKNIKLDIGKLYLIVDNEKRVATELAEFREKFANRWLEFYKFVREIPDKVLKSAINILKSSLDPQVPHKYTMYQVKDIWIYSLLNNYHDIDEEIIVNEKLHTEYCDAVEFNLKDIMRAVVQSEQDFTTYAEEIVFDVSTHLFINFDTGLINYYEDKSDNTLIVNFDSINES